jgi:hypothetical protein
MSRAVVLLLTCALVSCTDAQRDGGVNVDVAEPEPFTRDATASEGAPDPGSTELNPSDPETTPGDAATGPLGVPSPGTTDDDSNDPNTNDPNTGGANAGGTNTGGTDTSAGPSNTTPGMNIPPAPPSADSGASGATSEPSTGPIVDGGAPESDASVAELPTLRLDPETLSFFTLPIGSIRYAVGGHSAEHGLCASIIWWDDPTRCGDLSESRAYVVLSEADAPPCEGWDYGPNVETTRAEGCVDARMPGEKGLVDLELDVSGELFSGRIIADNRSTFSPAPVTFGLFVTSAEPATLYVQSGGTQGSPGWVQGYRDGEAVNFFDRRNVPNCDGSPSSDVVGNVQTFMQNAVTGAVFTTWDGNLYVETDSEGSGFCETHEPAPPGDVYSVQLCFGADVLPNGSGDWVLDPVCVLEPFELPTENVFAEAQHP